MRYIIYSIALTGLLLGGCGDAQQGQETQSPEKESKSGFMSYIESLDPVDLPFSHNPMASLPKQSAQFDSTGFESYHAPNAVAPLGILFQNDQAIGIMDYGLGDYGEVPYLTVYSPKGKKISSLSFYEKSGEDMGYEALEYLTIQKDLSIMIRADIKRWDLNKKGTDIVKKSMTLTSDTVRYQVLPSGKIEKK